MREAADMGSSVMLDSDIQLHLADAGINVEDIREMLPDELDRRAAKILSGLRDDVYDDSGRATLANWLEAQPVANPWPLLQNWLDHLGPEEAEDDLRMLLMAIAADKAGDRDPHPAEDQEQEREREWRAGRWRELRLRVADIPEHHPGLQGFKDQLEALRDEVGWKKDNAMGDLEDALINAGLNESTVMTAKQLKQLIRGKIIREASQPTGGVRIGDKVWLRDGSSPRGQVSAKVKHYELGQVISVEWDGGGRSRHIASALTKTQPQIQRAEVDVAGEISEYFGTKKMAKKFVERVEEVGFEQAAVDFNLGADSQYEVGVAMGEYKEE